MKVMIKVRHWDLVTICVCSYSFVRMKKCIIINIEGIRVGLSTNDKYCRKWHTNGLNSYLQFWMTVVYHFPCPPHSNRYFFNWLWSFLDIFMQLSLQIFNVFFAVSVRITRKEWVKYFNTLWNVIQVLPSTDFLYSSKFLIPYSKYNAEIS